MENKTEKTWHKTKLPEDLDEGYRLAQARMLMLAVRVRDDTIRDLVRDFKSCSTAVVTAKRTRPIECGRLGEDQRECLHPLVVDPKELNVGEAVPARPALNMEQVSIDAGISMAFDAIVGDRLAVLLGAGFSMAPPSCLPSAASLAATAKAKYDARSNWRGPKSSLA
jgi:hypothetical protein